MMGRLLELWLHLSTFQFDFFHCQLLWNPLPPWIIFQILQCVQVLVYGPVVHFTPYIRKKSKLSLKHRNLASSCTGLTLPHRIHPPADLFARLLWGLLFIRKPLIQEWSLQRREKGHEYSDINNAVIHLFTQQGPTEYRGWPRLLEGGNVRKIQMKLFSFD